MARTYPTTVTANSVTSSTKFNDETVLQLQHLLGFTLDGDDLDSITTPKEIHRFKHRVAPSTPSSGNTELYVDSSDDHPKIKQSSGAISYWGEQYWTRKITLNSNGQFEVTLSDYEESVGASSLEIMYRLRSPTVSTQALLYIAYNDEFATTNYKRQGNVGQDNANASTYANDQIIDVIPAASSPANNYAYGRIFIHNLGAGDEHVIEVAGGSRYDTAKLRNNRVIQTWANTNAITKFRIRCSSSTDILAGSWIKLRFIKDLT